MLKGLNCIAKIKKIYSKYIIEDITTEDKVSMKKLPTKPLLIWKTTWDSEMNLVEFKMTVAHGQSMRIEHDALKILNNKEHKYYRKSLSAKSRHKKYLVQEFK